jgi:hypothetical protein
MNIFVMVKHKQALAFPLPLWERGRAEHINGIHAIALVSDV